MDNKIKSDINWILTKMGYDESEIDRYVQYEAQTQTIDLSNPSKEDIQALLQELILSTGKKILGFSSEIGEEPSYILLAIKDIVPQFDYKNFQEVFYLDGEQTDDNPIDVDTDFEIKVSFTINDYKFEHSYDDIQYIEELVEDISREVLIPMFNVRFYNLVNEIEIPKFVLFPSSVEPEEFFKYSDYL